MCKKWKEKALLGLIAVCLPLSFLAYVHYGTTDGLLGLVFSFMGEDTEYTKGYTESGFRRISQGMTVEEVHAILGPPHGRWDTSENKNGTEYGERWSWSPGSNNYRCRTILFKDNRVDSIHAEFYVD